MELKRGLIFVIAMPLFLHGCYHAKKRGPEDTASSTTGAIDTETSDTERRDSSPDTGTGALQTNTGGPDNDSSTTTETGTDTQSVDTSSSSESDPPDSDMPESDPPDSSDTATWYADTETDTDTETGTGTEMPNDTGSAIEHETVVCCPNGFLWDGAECVDIDECKEATHDCHADALCINTPGSYACECFIGYSGDGTTCVFEDECEMDGDCDHDRICVTEDEGRRCVHPSCSPQKVGSIGGRTRDVDVRDGIAYVAGDAGGVFIYDMSDPANPQPIGHTEVAGRAAVAVAVAGNLAFVTAQRSSREDAVVIVDVSDPGAPSEVSDIPVECTDLRVVGDELYIINRDELLVVDMSVPESPTVVGRHALPAMGYSIFVVDGIAYVLTSAGVYTGGSLTIFDVSTPSAPAAMGTLSVDSARFQTTGLAVNGSTAYIVGFPLGSLLVADVSNPEAPALVDTVESLGTFGRLSLVGDRLYGHSSGMAVFDVSVPEAPTQIAAPSSDLMQNQRMVVDGALGYAVFSQGVRILDLSGAVSFDAVGSFAPPGGFLHMAVDGDAAYLANSERLYTVSLQTPMNPRVVTDVIIDVNDLAASDGYVYVSNDTGLTSIDARQPDTLRIVGELPFTGGARALALDGATIYLGSGDYETGYHLRGVDIADPAAPTLLGDLPLERAVGAIDTVGDIAYVSAGTAFLVVDTAIPSTPEIVGTLEATEYTSLFAQGGRVFATWSGFLSVIDAGIPSRPFFEGTRPDTGIFHPGFEHIDSLQVINDTLYGVDSANKLQIYDISDLDDPTPTTSILTTDSPYFVDINVRDGFAFCPSADGFYVFDVSAKHNSKVVGRVAVDLAVGGMAVQDGVLYSSILNSDSGDDIIAIDVHDPERPAILDAMAHAETGFHVSDLAIDGHTAYAVATDLLALIDISDPAALTVISDTPLPADFEALGVAVSGPRVYIVGAPDPSRIEGNLLVFDISAPETPLRLPDNGALMTRGSAIAVEGGYAYVATESGLSVFTLEAPESPALVAEIPAEDPWLHRDLLVSGTRLYLVLRSGFMTLDLRTPDAPVVDVALDIPDCVAREVALLGQDAYVACDAGVAVVDVSDAAHPVFRHYIHPPGGARLIAADDSAVYSAYSGIDIIAPGACR